MFKLIVDIASHSSTLEIVVWIVLLNDCDVKSLFQKQCFKQNVADVKITMIQMTGTIASESSIRSKKVKIISFSCLYICRIEGTRCIWNYLIAIDVIMLSI